VASFDADNRGGIERTLHRISAIRNRRGDVVGLTCRIGRAVYGTIDIIEDIITAGKSALLLGPPGVGKTTMLREAARVLGSTRRVVIVDTSNEIGGDGDVPHPAIGNSRRMQVAQPMLQHEVMIEAVENHNPEVIIIDEIGRELEAQAARTIAERGVQLIGTAHGNTLENILRNPTLSDLVGGVESVTLSDEEARRRGTQKTVLERRSPPTFDVLIEIQDRQRLVVHQDVAAAVDAHLRGRPLPVEVRYRNRAGEIVVETMIPQTNMLVERSGVREARDTLENGKRRRNGNREHSSTRNGERDQATVKPDRLAPGYRQTRVDDSGSPDSPEFNAPLQRSTKRVQVYAYGVARNRLLEAAAQLDVPLLIVDDMRSADVLVTIKTYYRRRPKLIIDAERRNIPIHVLRANTANQVENFLADVFNLDMSNYRDPFTEAIEETRQAIQKIRAGAPSVDLRPQSAHIRRRQHELVRDENLVSKSYGSEPHRHVRVMNENGFAGSLRDLMS
jgi:stage III sporulation protein SpoIIIAA